MTSLANDWLGRMFLDLAVDASSWSDAVPVPTFVPRMVCTKCGAIGADVRPNWREVIDAVY